MSIQVTKPKGVIWMCIRLYLRAMLLLIMTLPTLMQGYKGKLVNANLLDVNGKVVYQNQFAVLASDATLKIKLQTKLARGIYYLQLSGDNLNQSKKLVIK